jgi:hypothetical protein
MTMAVAERSALADVQALGQARRLIRGYLDDRAGVDDLAEIGDLELALVRMGALLAVSLSGASGMLFEDVLDHSYQALARSTIDR